MDTIAAFSHNWFFTPDGEPRGYIDAHALTELWLHTGTACNLACPFCLEGSGPADKRLQLVKLADVAPVIEEALGLGVEQFSFTGGEPFLAKDMVKILQLAASHRPCLVLTNATEPLQRRIQQVLTLRDCSWPVRFRVSLDHPTAADHDRGRGEGNFAKALVGLKMLHDAGFGVSVARHRAADEDRSAVEAAYRALFAAQGLPSDLTLVAFPDLALPGSHPQVPQVTTDCMTRYHTEESRRRFMCAFSKMVVKQAGRMRVYACTLVDDDREYDLGGSLREALAKRISMRHHRCYSCFAYGASCSETSR